MSYKEKQRKIAEWRLMHGFAEANHPVSITRDEIMKMIESTKEKIREMLLKEFIEDFGEPYRGDIIEDIVMDNNSRALLEKMIG